jgi:hypothetical protein
MVSGIDVHLRSLPEFAVMAARAVTVPAFGCQAPLRIATPYDAVIWWHGRDLDHLEIQRAVRLAADKQSAVETAT